MAEPLPLHPGGGTARSPGPGQEIRARRDRIRKQVGPARWRESRRALLVEAARGTLQLAGDTVSESEMAAVRAGGAGAAPVFAPSLGALARLEAAAVDRDPTADLIAEVHAIATGAPGSSPFRAAQIEPQFQGASLFPPQTIALRLGELIDWLSGESGKDLETGPRTTLFFARFLEISPFARANFRVAHLMLSFFALADDQPPIWFEVADAAGIRDDVSRAFRFDTAPLTARIEQALYRSLERIVG